ncbi:hypothetical protein [Candidatus Accumulibacter sp. ACC003]|nr:hypothetical protein [Candidatus Accumulibacter sp. ACC003]
MCEVEQGPAAALRAGEFWLVFGACLEKLPGKQARVDNSCRSPTITRM